MPEGVVLDGVDPGFVLDGVDESGAVLGVLGEVGVEESGVVGIDEGADESGVVLGVVLGVLLGELGVDCEGTVGTTTFPGLGEVGLVVSGIGVAGL